MNIYVGWGSFCDANILDSHGNNLGSFGLLSEFDFNYTNSTFGSSVESFYAQGSHTNWEFSPPAPAGVWMSGGAPAADSAGNVYVTVGNGNFEGTTALGLNFGNSIVKLGGSSLSVPEDYYTPNIWFGLNNGASNVVCSGSGNYCGTQYLCSLPACTITLSQGDWDFGSGGVVLLTSSSTSAYGELVAAGKEGMFYVTYYCSGSNTQNQCPVSGWNQLMGGLDGVPPNGGYGTDLKSLYTSVTCTVSSPTNPTPGAGYLAQCFYGTPVNSKGRSESGERATPAYWPGTTPYLYTVGTHDVIRARAFNTSTGIFNDPADATSSASFGYPGATPTISSNGTNFNSAVLWVLDTSAFGSSGLDVLTAYAAKPNGSSLGTPLWTSASGTGPGVTKFMVPTVANGRVYVAGQGQQTGGCGTTCGGLLVIYH